MTAVPGGLVAATTPYPWPWDGALAGSRLALVVTGTDARSLAAVADPQSARTAVAQLADAALGVGALVVAVTHPGDDGVPARPDLGSLGLAGAAWVPAAGLDGFFGSRLDRLLRSTGRDQLLLAGFGLETTVHSTMRSANDRGYECLLVLDATAPVDPGLTVAARSMVEMSGGIFGAVGATADVRAALEALREGDLP